MGYHTYTKLFTTCIVPILDYCSAVWGHTDCSKIDQIQSRAMRVYLGVNRYAPLLGIIGDMGWTPGAIRRKIETIRLWNRLIEMDENRITKKVFMDIYNQNLENTWCFYVKTIFSDLEEENVYRSVCTYDLKILKDKLTLAYQSK